MRAITRNKGILNSLLFNTLDRKEVLDTEARINYKDILFEYCSFIHRLSAIELSTTLNLKLNKQFEFMKKLEILSQRHKSIGTDAIPNDKVEDFLTNLQTYIREWINADYLEIDLRTEENKWFNLVAYQLSGPTSPILERKKSEAIDILIDSNRKRVNF